MTKLIIISLVKKSIKKRDRLAKALGTNKYTKKSLSFDIYLVLNLISIVSIKFTSYHLNFIKFSQFNILILLIFNFSS